MKRTLSLKRETLAVLTNEDLVALGGAGPLPMGIQPPSLNPLTTCVVLQSVGSYCSGQACNTWNSDCSCNI